MPPKTSKLDAIKKKAALGDKKARERDKTAKEADKKAKEAASKKQAASKRKANELLQEEEEQEQEQEEEVEGKEETDDSSDGELKKKEEDLQRREKLLKIKEQQLIKKSSKPLPTKRGRKTNNSDETVDVISVKYQVEPGRPNNHLNDTWGNAIVDDIVGFGDTVTLQDVSLFIYLPFIYK